jgi:hypothetical protein
MDDADLAWAKAVAPLRDGFHAHEFFRRVDIAAIEVADSLCDALCNHEMMVIGAAIKRRDFDELATDDRRLLTGAIDYAEQGGQIKFGAHKRPYFAAFQLAIAQVEVITPKGEAVAFMFDDQKQYEAYAHEAWRRIKWLGDGDTQDKLLSLSFGDRRKLPLLQAADLVAYLWFQHHSGANLNDLEARVFQDIAALGEPRPWTKAEIHGLLDAAPSKLRARLKASPDDGDA